MKGSRLSLTVAAPALAISLAVVISTLVLVISDNSPGEVFSLLADQLTDGRALARTLNRAAPYYVSGVAVAVGFKMNLFNIGVEGQYRLAGVIAAAAGAALPLPGPLRLLGILAVAVLVGAAWAGIAGVLRAYRGVSEVISTIMLNTIAFGLTPFLLTRYLQAEKPEGSVDYSVRTEGIPKGGRLPVLDALTWGGTRINTYIVVAALVGVVYWVLIWRSRFGFDLRASGANPHAARSSGVDARRMTVLAMAISGGIAGLVGLSTIVSSPYRYTEESFLADLGFTGIAIALLGRNHPIGIALGALLWAFVDVARTPLASANLPQEITTIMQGVIVLSVVVAYEVVKRVGRRLEVSDVANEVGEMPPDDPPPTPAGRTTGVGA